MDKMQQQQDIKSLLVVGADSRIGKYFYRYFKSNKNFITYGTSYKDSNYLKLDLMDNDFLIPNPVGRSIALIFASKSSHSYCEQFPELSRKVNVENTLKLVSKLNQLGWQSIYFSSTHVFSGARPWVSVEAPRNPGSEFGRQKAELESEIIANNQNLIIRVTKVLNLEDNPFKEWLKTLNNSKLIKPYKDYPISPISISSLYEGTMEILNYHTSGIWHLGNSEQCDYAEVAFQLAKNFGYDTQLIQETTEYQALDHYPKYASLDVSSTQKYTNWKPESISSAIESCKKSLGANF